MQMNHTYETFIKTLEKERGGFYDYNGVRYHFKFPRLKPKDGTRKVYRFASTKTYPTLEALLGDTILDGQTIQARYAELSSWEGRKKKPTYEAFVESLIKWNMADFIYKGNMYLISIPKAKKRNGLFRSKETVETYSLVIDLGFCSADEMFHQIRIDGQPLNMVFHELEKVDQRSFNLP